MATVTRFEDLKVWQKCRILCDNIFQIIQSDKFLKDYKLKDQINGSSGSVIKYCGRLWKKREPGIYSVPDHSSWISYGMQITTLPRL